MILVGRDLWRSRSILELDQVAVGPVELSFERLHGRKFCSLSGIFPMLDDLCSKRMFLLSNANFPCCS